MLLFGPLLVAYRDPGNRLRMMAVPYGSGRGRTAASNYQTLQVVAGGGAAVVQWKLETGRTHQIRWGAGAMCCFVGQQQQQTAAGSISDCAVCGVLRAGVCFRLAKGCYSHQEPESAGSQAGALGVGCAEQLTMPG